MDRQSARQLIETLRSGVPSLDVSSVLIQGQVKLLERVQSDLDDVATGEQRSLIIRGQYGQGKSHFLSAIENKARADGFAVSNIVLSKEMPINRINKTYEAIARAITGNFQGRSGFEDILLRLHPGARDTLDIIDYIEKNLHQKIAYVFRNYFREGDIIKRAQLYDDLAGMPLSTSTLRAMHRSNFGERLNMRRFLINEHTWDYFRFLAFLLRRTGYKGWVILMDEAELLGKLGVGSRAQAYVNLAALLGLDNRKQPLRGAYIVLALASPFIPEVLQTIGRNDMTKTPEWLRDPRRNRSHEAPMVESVMKSIVEDSQPLEPLTEENVRAILQQLEAYHSLAYSWDGHMNQDFVLSRSLSQPSNSTRTTIRAGLEYLDLYYQYGYPPAIEIQPPDIDSLDENPDFDINEDHT